MTHDCPTSLIHSDCFIKLSNISDNFDVNLKIEGLSVTGSIKIKPAKLMVAKLEEAGKIKNDSILIESSSGNLGVALSMVCATKNYPFICVSDPNISPLNRQLIHAYGAELKIVEERDANGGYLSTRLNYIEQQLQSETNLIWLNQYENPLNVEAHYQSTAKEILAEFPKLDYLFVGAGTTGTLGGVSRFFREVSPDTKIIAVDTAGSVTFGGKPGKRHIPGLGTSVSPPISKYSSFDEMLLIEEIETVKVCREFARRGLLVGGSTGTVIAGIRAYSDAVPPGSCVAAISPDLGEHYLDTIYDDDWCQKNFGFEEEISSSSNQ